MLHTQHAHTVSPRDTKESTSKRAPDAVAQHWKELEQMSAASTAVAESLVVLEQNCRDVRVQLKSDELSQQEPDFFSSRLGERELSALSLSVDVGKQNLS